MILLKETLELLPEKVRKQIEDACDLTISKIGRAYSDRICFTHPMAIISIDKTPQIIKVLNSFNFKEDIEELIDFKLFEIMQLKEDNKRLKKIEYEFEQLKKAVETIKKQF